MPVEARTPPSSSLLVDAVPTGGYADAFALEVDRSVTLADWLQAFYTAPLFRCERVILTLIGRPSRDADVAALARGERQSFAAWQQQARREHEILMRDFTGRTGSWLAVEALPGGRTRLWFGSGGWPRKKGGMGGGFNALLGLHLLYSRALLQGGAKRLRRLG